MPWSDTTSPAHDAAGRHDVGVQKLDFVYLGEYGFGGTRNAERGAQ